MIILLEDYDVILINLEEVFGKIVQLSELDATKVKAPDHPDRTLTVDTSELNIILDYIDDMVVSELTPRLIARLGGPGIKRFTMVDAQDQLWEDISETLEDVESESDEETILIVVMGKQAISKEGLEMIDRGIVKALTEGSLAKWQEGVEQYAYMQLKHEEKHQEALNLISNAATYRTSLSTRISIPKRTL